MSKKILLVEDEAIIALSEAQMLKEHGYAVVTTGSGERAIEAAETILRRRDLPVVFLSSHTEPEVVEKTEGITSYGYIVKNSGETVLLASIPNNSAGQSTFRNDPVRYSRFGSRAGSHATSQQTDSGVANPARSAPVSGVGGRGLRRQYDRPRDDHRHADPLQHVDPFGKPNHPAQHRDDNEVHVEGGDNVDGLAATVGELKHNEGSH